MKKELTNIFIDEIYSKPPKRNYPSNKRIYNHVYEIWSLDLADMVDYKVSNNKGIRYIIIKIDNFSKYLRTLPLKKKYSQTKTQEFSIIQNKSKRSPVKLENERSRILY